MFFGIFNDYGTKRLTTGKIPCNRQTSSIKRIKNNKRITWHDRFGHGKPLNLVKIGKCSLIKRSPVLPGVSVCHREDLGCCRQSRMKRMADLSRNLHRVTSNPLMSGKSSSNFHPPTPHGWHIRIGEGADIHPSNESLCETGLEVGFKSSARNG